MPKLPKQPKEELSAPKEKGGILDPPDDVVVTFKTFQQTFHHELYTAEEENAAAKALKHHERHRWSAILGYRPIYAPLSDLIKKSIDLHIPEKIDGIAESLLMLSTRKKFRSDQITKIIELFFEADVDRLLVDHIEKEIAKRLSFTLPTQDSGFLKDFTISPANVLIRKLLKDYIADIQAARKATLRARNSFINFNMRLVIFVAKRYSISRYGLEDLVQEGVFGLLKAINRFDPSRGTKFSTFATWWIRHAIGRAIADKGKLVRVPVHRVELSHRISKTEDLLFSEKEGSPSNESIAKELGTSVKIIKECRDKTNKMISMDSPLHRETEKTVGDFIADTRILDIHEIVQSTELKSYLKEALSELSPREKRILFLRYGIGTGEEKTLEQIGDNYDLTRERIRQIESIALTKLRTYMNTKQIRA